MLFDKRRALETAKKDNGNGDKQQKAGLKLRQLQGKVQIQ